MVGGCGLHSSSWGYGSVAISCEHDIKPSDSIKAHGMGEGRHFLETSGSKGHLGHKVQSGIQYLREKNV